MDLRACRKVVLFGGSFDPPHVAHVALPLQAMEQIDADAVVYIPAGAAPHKQGRAQTPAHHRLAMLRLALETVARAVILEDEIDRCADGQPSYTVETLESLRQRLGPKVEMRLLIGADMLRIFSQWRQPGRILELATPLAVVRPPDTRESLLAIFPAGPEREQWSKRMIDLPQMDVSSTDIRARVARGAPITGFVAPPVEDYIRRQGLYQNGK